MTPGDLAGAVVSAIRAAVADGELAGARPRERGDRAPEEPGARRLRHQRRAAAGQAGRPAAARGRRGHRRAAARRRPASTAVDVAGPGLPQHQPRARPLGRAGPHRSSRPAPRTGTATHWPGSGSTWSSSRPTRPARCTSAPSGGPRSATRSARVLQRRRRRRSTREYYFNDAGAPDRPVRPLAAGARPRRPAGPRGRLRRRRTSTRSPRDRRRAQPGRPRPARRRGRRRCSAATASS